MQLGLVKQSKSGYNSSQINTSIWLTNKNTFKSSTKTRNLHMILTGMAQLIALNIFLYTLDTHFFFYYRSNWVGSIDF